MKFLSCFSLLLLILCGRMAQGAPRYSVTDLGDFAGGEDHSQAFDVNAAGQVVGFGQNSSRFRAFLSSTAPGGETTLIDLGSLPTLPSTHGNAINSLGQIVGSSADGDKSRAFLWSPVAPNDSQGSMVELLGLPGERNSASATSINGRGQVVGYSRGHAFLWTPDLANGTSGTAVDLGGLSGAIGSLALDVNDSGQVAGISSAGTDRAFLWTPSAPNGTSGSMKDLGSLPGGSGASQAIALNAAGIVVGNSATATGQHAVLWKTDSSGAVVSMVDLGDLEGGNDLSSATGVNNANQVVGNSNSSDSDHAFFWSEADGMLDLNSLTDEAGASWVLRYAQSINDAGQIAGWGTFDPDGAGPIPPVTHAFRLETVGETQPARLANISTRVRVLPGDNALIAGFIITGTEPKKVIIRGLGPSLGTGALTDPILELHHADVILAQNNNWQDTQAAEIQATTIPPSNERESAIVMTLDPGTYTAILRGRDETSGTGLVEVYDLGLTASSKLANISTRGLVGAGDDAMIGGLIVSGDSGQTNKVIVRATGPSLSNFGVPGTLQDPTVELRDRDGALIASNDNWRTDHEAEIIATNFAPSENAESAIIATLAPGNYTAIVRGVNASTGIALVEVFNLR
jgi:probable HAF family extracellular repeat protein